MKNRYMSTTSDTSAVGSIAGFVYQIYFFLYQLLLMRKDDIVSLEKIDDVGTESDERRTYYQLKHTLGTTPTTTKYMTDRDTDLWKTLSLWVNIVKNAGNEETQRNLIAKSDFALISNKSTKDNQLVKLLEAYKETKEDEKWTALKVYVNEQALKEPKEGKKDEDKEKKDDKKSIYFYTKNVNDFPLLRELMEKVYFEFETDEEIKNKIDDVLTNQKYVPAGHSSNLRELLMGRLVGEINKKATEYTPEKFNTTYGSLFQKMLTRKFVPTPRDFKIPDDPTEQTFVRQLRDIDAPRSKTIKDIIQLTEQKLAFENDYNHANAVAGAEDQKAFEADVFNRWYNAFDHNDNISASSSKEQIKDAGRKVLKEVRSQTLKYDKDDLDTVVSNGCFYHFSDGESPRIGWRFDWKEKYNGQEWIIE